MTRFLFSLVLCLSVNAHAVCDFSTVRSNPDGSYTYSRECHIEVGKAVKSVDLYEQKVDLLEKQIELKDLQISKYDQRVKLWMDTSMQLNDKLMSYESTRSSSTWVAFGLGILTVVAAGYAVGQVAR